MGCGMSLIKYLLFLFNLVFALSGLTLLVLGVLILTETKVYHEFLDGKFDAPPILLIVVGVIVFIVAFLGCCGAIRESHCMVISFAILLLVIFIIGIVIGSLAFVYSNDTEDVFDNKLQSMVNDYYKKPEAADAMDIIQEALKCCGHEGPKDYLISGKGLPKSCCVKSDQSCKLIYDDSKVTYTTGCGEALKNFIRDAGIILGGVAIGVAVIEFIGIIFALCLANSIKNKERRQNI